MVAFAVVRLDPSKRRAIREFACPWADLRFQAKGESAWTVRNDARKHHCWAFFVMDTIGHFGQTGLTLGLALWLNAGSCLGSRGG